MHRQHHAPGHGFWFLMLVALVGPLLLGSSPALASAAIGADLPGGSGSGAPRSGEVAPDRLLLRFAPGSPAADRAGVRALLGGRVMREIGLVPGLEIIETPMGAADAQRRLAGNPNVLYVEPDRVIQADVEPNDPQYDNQWGLENDLDNDIDAAAAWDLTTGSAAIVVAVIDSGVKLDHADLAANIWANPGEIPANGLDDDGNGFTDDVKGWDFWDDEPNPSDVYGHGTHVAGTIAAVGNNGVGVTGVSWSSRLMSLRVLGAQGFGSVSDGIAALDYAWRNGARVANLSWGYYGGVSQPLHDVVAAASDGGMLVVAAAGNAGLDLDFETHYPAGLDVPLLLSVAALDETDALADFSNYGAQGVDLGAPGVDVLSTTIGSYGYASGTSMAAPHVAGVAALVFAADPNRTVAQVRARILAGVRPLEALAGKVASGGALNALAALAGPADAPPVVTIASPLEGLAVLPGTSVTLTGAATDAEDGSLTGSLAWASSQDGALGSGPSLSRSNLSTGVHLITATAEDSAGHVVVRAVRIHIGPTVKRIAAAVTDGFPAVAVSPSGVVTMAYGRTATGTFLATRGPAGTWSSKLAVPSFSDLWVDSAPDQTGAIHVAIQRNWSSTAVYGDPGILVAVQEGATWRIDRVTDACTDGSEGCHGDWTPRLALGPEDEEHVVFVRAGPHGYPPQPRSLHVATRLDNGSWSLETLDASGDVTTPAIAVAPDGTSHVVYFREGPAGVGTWYATDASGSWVKTRLTTTDTDRWPSVVVAPNGSISVAISTPGGTRVRTKTAVTWNAWTTVFVGETGELDLVADTTSHLHLVIGRLTQSSAAGISYVTNAGGGWAATSLSNGQDIQPSIALDAAGKVHVGFITAWPSQHVRYATNTTGSWVLSTVASGGTYGAPAYAVDGRGVAHAASARFGTAPGVWVGMDQGGAWTWARAITGVIDGDVALATNSIGEATLAYATRYDLAMNPLPSPGMHSATNASGTWVSTKIGPSAVGTPSLALDAAGRAHVVWPSFEGGLPGTFYATNASGAWVTKRLTSADDQGVAMVLDASGRLHLAIARGAANARRIVYMTNKSGAWSAQFVSPAGAVDLSPSIALDAAGAPSIAYARLNTDIRLTELRPTGWATRIVTSDPIALAPSLRIDSDGTRQLLFSEHATYAVCDDPLCPDYPGIRHAVGGPTGPFTVSRLTASSYDSSPALVRGRDGSLGGAFVSNALGVYDLRLTRPPARTATSIAYQGPTSMTVGATVTLSAKLTAAGVPLAGKSLVFKVDGVVVGSATTSAAGVASRSYHVPASPGAHTVTVGFSGGGAYLAARAGPLPITIAS